jgi:hypothetical protein
MSAVDMTAFDCLGEEGTARTVTEPGQESRAIADVTLSPAITPEPLTFEGSVGGSSSSDVRTPPRQIDPWDEEDYLRTQALQGGKGSVPSEKDDVESGAKNDPFRIM